MKFQMLGQAAVLTHSIDIRERTDAGEETVHEVETIVFGRQPDGRWLIVHQHLSPNGTESLRARRLLYALRLLER